MRDWLELDLRDVPILDLIYIHHDEQCTAFDVFGWLKQLGYETARDVLKKTAKGLQEHRGIGPKTAEKIARVLGDFGWKLAEEGVQNDG